MMLSTVNPSFLKNVLHYPYVLQFCKSTSNFSLCRVFSSYPAEAEEVTVEKRKARFCENNALYKHLLNNKNYRQTIAFLDYAHEKSITENIDTILNCDLTEVPNFKLVEYFKTLLQSFSPHPHKLCEPKFVEFCSFLIGNLSKLLDDHLLNILKILTLWPRGDDGNDDLFFEICKAVDGETSRRQGNWGRDRLLLTMDHFHRLQVLNYSSFAWDAMKKVSRNPERLTTSQLIHALFLSIANRKRHPGVDFFYWELTLVSRIYEMSAEEAAIVALGFFKSSKPISNPNLIEAFILKLESRMDTLDSVFLTALLKILKYSVPSPMRHRLLDLLGKLEFVIDQKSLTCCVYIASLGTRQPVFHYSCLCKAFTRFVDEISNARLKEIERMLFVASTMNFIPPTNPDFFDAAIKELKNRNDEISEFPSSFIYAVQYLCRKQIFHYEFIDKVLSEDFLIHRFKGISKHSVPSNVVEIACSAKLDCPDYAGSNLNTDFLNVFNNFYNRKSCAVVNKGRTKREITYMQSKAKLEEMFGGSQFVHCAHVLPYSNSPQLIFCLKNGKPISFPEDVLAKYYVEFKPASNIGDWYAFEFSSSGARIGNTGEPVGSVHSKLRHLRLLGYKCALLEDDAWHDLNQDKIKLLQSLIEQCT